MNEKLHELIYKLAHPLSEVNIRSANALIKKLQLQICSVSDLLSDSAFISNLNVLLKNDLVDAKLVGLNLLEFVLQDSRGRVHFESSGGRILLEELKLCSSTNIEKKIETALNEISQDNGADYTSSMPEESHSIASSKETRLSMANNPINHCDPLIELEIQCNESSLAGPDGTKKKDTCILLYSFAWVNLTDVDVRVLDAVGNQILDEENVDLLSTLFVVQSSVLVDFPCEVFLQRPKILNSLLNRFECSKSPDSVIGVKVLEGVSNVLQDFMEKLLLRMSCPESQILICISSLETVTEVDDSESFQVLQKSQMSVLYWCCQLLKRSCEIMKIASLKLLRSLFTLIPLTMKIIHSCLEEEFWENVANEGSIDQSTDRNDKDVASSLLQCFNILSTSVYHWYKFRDRTCSEDELELSLLRVKIASSLMIAWMSYFSSSKPELFLGSVEKNAIVNVLCDPCFYMEQTECHGKLLMYLQQVDSEISNQISSLIDAAKSLSSTKNFLNVSSITSEEFLEQATRVLPYAFLHRSQILIEKIVRGTAKQYTPDNISALQQNASRRLILQILTNPDSLCRMMGYNAVKGLIAKTMSVFQEGQSKIMTTGRLFVFFHQSIINHFIYSGFADKSHNIRDDCRAILQYFLYYWDMFPHPLQRRAMDCWLESLLSIQILVDSVTSLGKIIFDLPYELYKRNKTKSTELLMVKFYLKCLLCKDKMVRTDGLKSCLALLVTNSTEYHSILPALTQIDQEANFLVFNPAEHIFSKTPISLLDRQHLIKLIHVLSESNLNGGLAESTWTQLVVLLRNPCLHDSLEKLWPISEVSRLLKDMMKVCNNKPADFTLIPLVLEVLYLRVFMSIDARSQLSNDSDFLLLILRISIIFHLKNEIQLLIATIFSLILNEEVVEQRSIDSSSGSCSISLPAIVEQKLNIAFKHSHYLWKPDFSMSAPLRDLWTLWSSPENSVLPVTVVEFCKYIWNAVCASNVIQLLEDFDFAASFSKNFVLGDLEKVRLRSYISVAYAAKLLRNIENATSHVAVKKNVNLMQVLFTLIQGEFSKISAILRLDYWTSSLSRFFLCVPSTSSDKQILYHVLSLLVIVLNTLHEVRIRDEECLSCQLVLHLIGSFAKPENSLAIILKEYGSKEFNLGASSANTLQNFMLLKSVMSVISALVRLAPAWKCSCSTDDANWRDFAATTAETLVFLCKKCSSSHECNMLVLIPCLECVSELMKTFPGCFDGLLEELIPVVINLLMAFHVGRGRSNNSYLGTAGTARALSALSSCVTNAETKNPELFKLIKSVIPGAPWILACIEHCDPSVSSRALKFALTLSSTPRGAELLDNCLDKVPGGIWSLCVRIFCRDKFSPPLRVLAVSVLCNLSALLIRLPDQDKPWNSLLFYDSSSGIVSRRQDALIAVLKMFNFVEVVKHLLRGITVSVNESDLTCWKESGIGFLDEYVLSEQSEWVSTLLCHADEDPPTWAEDYPEIMQVALKFVCNLILFSPLQFCQYFNNSDLPKFLIQQVCYFSDRVRDDAKWHESVEWLFRILRNFKPLLTSATHVAPLAVNVFSSASCESFQAESFCVLMTMLEAGKWGSVRVLELIKASSVPVIKSLIQFLHASNPRVNFAVMFVGFLCKTSICENVPAHYSSSLKDLLDTPVQIYSPEENSFPGFEICRHLLQLLPSKTIRDICLVYGEKISHSEANLKLSLESLKMLLRVSETAKDCAFSRAADLLKPLSFALSNLSSVIQDLNLHITVDITKKKETECDILFAIHSLQVATNWVCEPNSGSVDNSLGPVDVASALVPLLHQLWLPALRAAPLIDATVQFLIAVCSHDKACPILTRTSTIPGALLSHSRTKNSILAAVTNNVNHLLVKRSPSVGRCQNDCKNMPRDLLEDTLDLIMNCARIHESAYVLVKEGFPKSAFEFLDKARNLSESIPGKLVQCLSVLALHKQGRASILKVPCWSQCLEACLSTKSLAKNASLIFIILVSENQGIKSQLTSLEFLKFILDLIKPLSEHMTDSTTSPDPYDEELRAFLLLLWALLANNERAKVFAKRLPLKPVLDHLYETGRQAKTCEEIIKIMRKK